MPSFTIGIDRCEGWGDWHIPEYDIPVEKDLAKHILNTGLENNVDFAFTMRMKVDHGHTQAIYFLNEDLEYSGCTNCCQYSSTTTSDNGPLF